MKLKLFAAALTLMGAAAGLQAQGLEDIRIYINPGHGSWTPDDRPMTIVGKPEYSRYGTDTTGFFESNTNLIKGFGVLEKLIEVGVPFDRTLNQTGERWEIGAARDLEQNLFMSRVKSGPYHDDNGTSNQLGSAAPADLDYYNRSLREIANECEANEFDMFISIHSNAASSDRVSTNFLSIIYRTDHGADPETCVSMATYCWNQRIQDRHNQWSHYDYPADQGSNKIQSTTSLGVIKHSIPGYLVEGYFHTYQPSRHRAMNWDVDIIEGYQYARSIIEYFELEESDPTGDIYGIVRDAHKKFEHQYYTPNPTTADAFMALNNTKVYLWKDGEKVQEYTTDNFHNGAFVFKNLEPGTYQVTFDAPEYDCSKAVDVEVEAGTVKYPIVFLTDIYYYSGRPGEDVNYADLVPEGAATLADSYTLFPGYSKEIAQLAGKTAKRMIWMKDLLYIYAEDAEGAPTILVVDKHGYVVANVSTEGCTGSIANVSDIAVTADGVLVACAKSLTHNNDDQVKEGEVRGEVNFYKWANDENGVPTGNPTLWFSTKSAGEWYRAYTGDTFAYTGTSQEGRIALSAVTTASTTGLRNAVLTIANGSYDDAQLLASRPSKFFTKDLGDDFRYSVSPIDRYQFLLSDNGTKYGLRSYYFEHPNNTDANSKAPETINCNTLGAGYFRYTGKGMMTLATGDSPVKLYDVSAGIDQPVEIILEGGETSVSSANVLTTGYPIAETDGDGNVVGGDFSIVVLRDAVLSRYATSEAAGVSDITIDREDNSSAEYYNIQGVRVANPSNGFYIRVQGNKASKVFVK